LCKEKSVAEKVVGFFLFCSETANAIYKKKRPEIAKALKLLGMLTMPIGVILISYACIVFYCACIVFLLFNIIIIIRQTI